MAIRDYRDLVRRGLLRIEGMRLVSPHPWETDDSTTEARAARIESEIGTDTIKLIFGEGWGDCPKCAMPYIGPKKPDFTKYGWPAEVCWACGEPRR